MDTRIGLNISYAAGGAETWANRFVASPELQPAGRGWMAEIETRIMPFIDALKPSCVLVHCPQGVSAKKDHSPTAEMDFDQYLLAEEAGMHWLTRDFARAMRIVSERIPLTIYTGNFKCAGMINRSFTWQSRAVRTTEPYAASGARLAVDASVGYADTTREAKLLTDWDRSRMPVSVEGRWQTNGLWCWDMPCYVIDSAWKAAVAAGFAGGYSNVRAPGTKEPACHRLLNNARQGLIDQARADVADCRARGHVPMVGPWGDWEPGKTLHEILEA